MTKPLLTIVIGLLLFPSVAFSVDVGDKAPDFSLKTESGETRSLSHYSGKVILLDFWASWCPPCLKSLPWFSDLKKKYAGKDFTVIAVNIDKEFSKAKYLLEKLDVDLEVLHDPKKKSAELYQLPTMPTSYLIDRSGKVIHIHKGFRLSEVEELKEAIESVINAGD